MISEQYKLICEQPNTFRLSELNVTLKVLRAESAPEAALISKAILGNKIEKPLLHNDNHQTDFVALDLTFEEADAIVDILFDSEACSIQGNGMPTSKTSLYVDLVNVWSNYRESLD